MPKTEYKILSPDGIEIENRTYSSIDEAVKAFETWVKPFYNQGYYSSNNGRIDLRDLLDYCTLVEL